MISSKDKRLANGIVISSMIEFFCWSIRKGSYYEQTDVYY